MSKALICLSVLLALMAATVLIAQKRGQIAMRKAPQTGEMVTTLSGQIVHVERYGPEGAPPIVLIHGASGSTYDMTFRLAPALAERYRVYVVDRPGFGYSPALGDESLATQAQTLREAISELEPRKLMVLGQSYGGAVALEWALQDQENMLGLVLVSAASHEWAGDPSLFYRTMATPVIGDIFSWMLMAYLPSPVLASEIDAVFAPQHAPEGYTAFFQPRLSLRPATQTLNARQRVTLKAQLRDMTTGYPSLMLPIETVHGTADTTVGLEVHAAPLARDVDSDHLVRLEGLGHMPHHVATQEVVAAVDRLTARLEDR
ncbi:alpha/beta hydrolase [Celeribacter baekdonensis]|uniref:alpha/beta fold hydrolase n=1 Tax=Celeribacter baekdonensis TaxID=875171 RepID=UPI0030D7E733